jgi:hypothetical protein
MSTSSRLTTVYCTDEDIAVTAGGDYALLCPRWQKLASGTDGSITASTWVLNSASASFVTGGLASGHVVWLQKPVATFKGQGDLFAVSSVAATALTLRRVGLATGVGQYPVTATTSSIEYQVLTLDPQIEESSFEMNRRFNIDAGVTGRTPSDVYDLRDLRQATVLDVLVRRLTSEIQDTKDASWAFKLKSYRMALDTTLARLSIRWGSTGSTAPEMPQFRTRLVR